MIDPLPLFDPHEHEQRFPGRYHFHRDVSLNVLPGLPAVDAALVDGDHNWYTVYNELKLLAATAAAAEKPLPLLVLHDVGWPYGRRDLYYAPERIPEQYRQPFAERGIRRGQAELLEKGGFNPRMNNALREGGPRNGVMTALEDFAKEHDGDLRIDVIPVYHSLAIVADRGQLDAHPQLAERLNHMATPKFLRQVLRLAESLRLNGVQRSQALFYNSLDRRKRAATRYLNLLSNDLPDRKLVELLSDLLETISDEQVAGDLLEVGSRETDGAVFMCGYVAGYELARSVWLAGATDPGLLRQELDRADLLDDRVEVLDNGAGASPERLALLRISDAADVRATLTSFYDRLSTGGVVVVEGYGEPNRRAAVDGFLAESGVEEADSQSDSTALRSPSTNPRQPAAPPSSTLRESAPCPPPAASRADATASAAASLNTRLGHLGARCICVEVKVPRIGKASAVPARRRDHRGVVGAERERGEARCGSAARSSLVGGDAADDSDRGGPLAAPRPPAPRSTSARTIAR